MIRALKTLRAVQWAMVASIVLYGIVGEVLGPVSRGVDPTLSYLFATLSVAIVGAIFVVRRTLVLRAAESLTTRPERVIAAVSVSGPVFRMDLARAKSLVPELKSTCAEISRAVRAHLGT